MKSLSRISFSFSCSCKCPCKCPILKHCLQASWLFHIYPKQFIIDACVTVSSVTSVVSDSMQPYGLLPARLLCPWGPSRQEYWSGLLCPPPGDLPDPGTEPASSVSPARQADFFTHRATWEALTTDASYPKHDFSSLLYFPFC